MTSQLAAFQTMFPGYITPTPTWLMPNNPNVDRASAPRPSKKKGAKKPAPKTPATKK